MARLLEAAGWISWKGLETHCPNVSLFLDGKSSCSLKLEMDPDKHPWTWKEIWMQALKLIFFSTGKEPPNFLFIPFLLSLTKQYFSDHVNFIYWLPSNYMVSNWMASQDWKWNTDCLTCRWVFQLCATPAVSADWSHTSAACHVVGFSPVESGVCIASNH